jgi:hypothetical protein
VLSIRRSTWSILLKAVSAMGWQDRKKEWENLQATQQKLGEAAMIWSTVDRCFDEIIADYLDLSGAEVAAIVEGMLAKKKIEVIRRLMLLDAPSAEWVSAMKKALVLADRFGEARNRLLHDNWRFELEKISRIERRAKKAKAQSHQPETLVVNSRINTSLDELQAICMQGYDALTALGELKPALLDRIIRRREMLSSLLS